MEYVTKISLKYEIQNDFLDLLRGMRRAVRFLRMEKMKLQSGFRSSANEETPPGKPKKRGKSGTIFETGWKRMAEKKCKNAGMEIKSVKKDPRIEKLMKTFVKSSEHLQVRQNLHLWLNFS